MLSTILLVSASQVATVPVDYGREIRPLLSDRCYTCHGPDEVALDGGFRLDLREETVADLGGYAANCLLARRLLERDVRFVQLYHQGWDQHDNLPSAIRVQCAETDRGSSALVQDLARRGLLEDTLVVWGGEFGRTCYSQGKLTSDNHGRDHHPRCFTMWMAGSTYGETDDFGYKIVRDPLHVHDFQATLLHLLGIDHERLTYRHRGRRFRLTDVHGRVVPELLDLG